MLFLQKGLDGLTTFARSKRRGESSLQLQSASSMYCFQLPTSNFKNVWLQVAVLSFFILIYPSSPFHKIIKTSNRTFIMTCVYLNNKAASLILSCKAEKAIKCLNNSLLEIFDVPRNISEQRPVAPKVNWLDRSNSLGKTKRCHAFDLEYDERMRTFLDILFTKT